MQEPGLLKFYERRNRTNILKIIRGNGTLRGAFIMQQKTIIIQRAQPQQYLVLLISRKYLLSSGRNRRSYMGLAGLYLSNKITDNKTTKRKVR